MQLPLPIDVEKHYALNNFIVADSNEFAFKRIAEPENWPVTGVLLYGELGCGKTHLLECWKRKNPTALCLDTIEDWQQTALFHAYNKAIQQQQRMLFTSRLSVGQLPFQLPDLKSRLSAMTAIKIQSPDDDLLIKFMQQQFKERQLSVNEPVINYLITQIPRNFKTAIDIVEQLDEASLKQKSAINKRLVDEVLYK